MRSMPRRTSSRTRVGGHSPRLLARCCETADLHRRPRSPQVSVNACPSDPPHGLAVPDVLPDGQPHAPAHRDAAAESRPRNAASAWRHTARRSTVGTRPPVTSSVVGSSPRVSSLTRSSGSRPPVHRPQPGRSRILLRRPEAWPWSSHVVIVAREHADTGSTCRRLLVVLRPGRRRRAPHLPRVVAALPGKPKGV